MRFETDEEDPLAESARERARARKAQSLVSLQREMTVQLVGAAFVFVLVTIAAAWFLARPNRHRSALAVKPVLVRFIELGAADDLTAARLLLSTGGLRLISEDHLREAAADKSLWRTPIDLEVNRFVFVDGEGGDDEAEVEATVSYAEAPPARLRAGLTYENNSWRISRFTLSRNAALP